jgi:hypothetical protein
VLKVLLDPTGLAGTKPSIFFMCYKSKMRDPFELVRGFWRYDFAESPYVPQSFTELSLSRLFEHRSEFNKWSEMFDTSAPLNADRFEKKWNDDFRLIEQTFGMTYDELVRRNWMVDVIELTYVTIAPYYQHNPVLLNHFYNKAITNLTKT